MATQTTPSRHKVAEVETVTIRFVGDSGDGMQLTGAEFMRSSALAGNDIATFPDFPAEIRAPAGSLFGVSGYQVNIGARDVHTPGDQPDVLVAMNPAAYKTNVADLRQGGMLIVNTGAFSAANLEKAGYAENPLEEEGLGKRYRVVAVDMTQLTEAALSGSGLSSKDVARCKNYFALGLVNWLYSRAPEPQVEAIRRKFQKKPALADANILVFRAGFDYGETSELFYERYVVPASPLEPGTYRSITGNHAAALGFATVAKTTGREVFFGGYPITPSSEIIQDLSHWKEHGVVTFQAEDEIAGIGSAIGAAFGGSLAVTATSGPGLALKTEMMGLAVIMELPLVIVDVQRGGPSTGMPTKTEQADLLMALFGRHGEAPMPVLAAQSPGDCFWAAMEAMRVAVRWMTPVLLLTDGYLANGSEPFRIPDPSELPVVEPHYAVAPNREGKFMPYLRDERLVRPWAIPGTPGLEHRVGGLEKDSLSGMVSYDGANHELMVQIRARKVQNVVEDVPDAKVVGGEQGDSLLVSWGGTYGSVRTAAEELRAQGKAVSHVHLRWLNPLPKNLGEVLRRFPKVLVPEVNDGQLAFYLRGRYPGVDPVQHNRINGKPLRVSELVEKAKQILERGDPTMSTPEQAASSAPAYTKKDFESGVDPRWCPGCGDYAIINQVQRTLPTAGVLRENIVFVSGIGCSSRFPYYMHNYGMHTVHGRAPSFATGLKLSRPELMVWVVTGDGDALAIGGNHFIHALRRNLDFKLLVFNNRIYGLTKGQVSPTSELGKKTKTTPQGSPDYPFNPPALALGAGGTFVARSIDIEGAHLGSVLKAAQDHRGTAFVEIYQNCPVFNDGAHALLTDKASKAEVQLRMEHGKPLLFGKELRKGIRLDPRSVRLEVVTVGEGGVTEADVLVHDAHREDPTLAFMLANLDQTPGFPTPIGVFRDVRRPTADEMTWAQVAEAKKGGKGSQSVRDFLGQGETWTVKAK